LENKNNLNKVSGFNDRFSNELSFSNELDYKFFEFTTQWGYEKIETPIIEKSSIFSRKTGSSIGSNVYNFTDPSGLEVALRADFTPSIMRSYLENEFSPNEMRFSYAGEIYKYDSVTNKNYSRQNGVELIGDNNLYSDLEIIAMAKIFLSNVLNEEIKINIGHVGILHEIIEFFGLGSRVGLFILQNMDFIKDESSNDQVFINAEENGIVFHENQSDTFDSKNNDISKVLDFAFHKDSKFEQTRDRDSIINGLMNKVSNNASRSKFLDCIELIRNLINVEGDLEKCISDANKILSNVPVKNNLKNLYDLANNLDNYEIDISDVNINFGLVREWGYYTGFVFNMTNDENQIFGGGGRYDSLGNSLGENLSATGFAIDAEKILKSNRKNIQFSEHKKIIIFINDEKDLNKAIKTCNEERSKGNIVSLKSSFDDLEVLKQWASKNEITEIIFFENNEMNRSEI